MTTQPLDDAGKKLIEALESSIDYLADEGDGQSDLAENIREAISIVRSLLAELAELRDKAKALEYLWKNRDYLRFKTILSFSDSPIEYETLHQMIEQKERT